MTMPLDRRAFLQVGASLAGSAARRPRAPSAAVGSQGERPSAEPLECDAFCDLQVNGFAGVDFNDPAVDDGRVREAARAMERTGVTRFLATLISAPLDRFSACARVLARSDVAGLAGIHMEGPYISPEDGPRGAHNRADVQPASLDDFARRQDAAGGRIKIVTVAPEVAGGLPLIERLVRDGVLVAIGHTAATPQQIRDAIAAGATLSTHLGNGCAQMLPRHPNFIWEQLAADELTAGLIVDGHHLPPSTVKAMIRAKSPDRVVLVTDATTAAGQPPGDYMLGTLKVHLDETGRVAVPGQPNLAGSALSLDRAVGNAVKFSGLPLATVLPMASSRPARLLGLAPRGRLRARWDAESSRLTVDAVLL
jgi:N-acetylglucosamine-6-phosphate deacetylase